MQAEKIKRRLLFVYHRTSLVEPDKIQHWVQIFYARSSLYVENIDCFLSFVLHIMHTEPS